MELPEQPGYRYEILEGEPIKDPSPDVRHQRVSRRLQRVLEDYFWQVDPDGEVFNAPLDVTFADITVVQPDIFYVPGGGKEIIGETRIAGAPTLVVEILSPSTSRKDRVQKLQIYRRAGVRHYWLVDPEAKTLECFALKAGRYVMVASGMDTAVVRHPQFSGLTVDLSRIWQ
ncbi:MAG: Uma2 family endonuclease [Firmicutes bacterium]|nr:Uma2 family endonuclease [Bacillota bacterium]